MNEQSSKPDFKQAVNPQEPKVQIDHSYEEMHAKMKIMSDLSKNAVDLNEIRQMFGDYKERITQNDDKRWKRDVWYQLGRGRGLHMEANGSELSRNRTMEDQALRNATMQRMAKFYKNHQSIKHDLNKVKGKEMDKGRDHIKGM